MKSPKSFQWTTEQGSTAISPILARFTNHGESFVVVPCGRSRYDFNPAYCVLRAADGELIP